MISGSRRIKGTESTKGQKKTDHGERMFQKVYLYNPRADRIQALYHSGPAHEDSVTYLIPGNTPIREFLHEALNSMYKMAPGARWCRSLLVNMSVSTWQWNAL